MMSADALLFFALLYHHDAAAGFMSLIWQFSSLATSLLIRKLLQWYEDPAKPVAKGYTLALLVGMAAVYGVAFLLCTLPLQGYIAVKHVGIQRKQMMRTDARIKLVNEILQSIKIIKLCAWEMPFHESSFNPSTVFTTVSLLLGIRYTLYTLPTAVASLIQARISLGRIQKYYELEDLDDSNRLWSNRSGISNTTASETSTTESSSSGSSDAHRHQQQHRARELYAEGAKSNRKAEKLAKARNNQQQTAAAGSTALPLHNSSVGSGTAVATNATDSDTVINYSNKQAPFELHLDFTAQPSELVAVVSSVATGKSALISAILNDMTRISGSVTVNGSIAYVAQTAFICNMTLRDNILFGAHYDQERYNAVLHACALTDDIALLPAGDLTEIDEKGINLSGGQRQRVSIARAAYANADIYLLDSPLSAVDTTVADHIFEKCFIQLLAGKTRILCTNQLQFLPQCDRILVLKCDGARSYISEQGTYSNLITQESSQLTQLMSTYSVTTGLCTTTDSNDIPNNSDDSSSTSSENDTDTTDTTAAVDTAAVLPDSLVRFTEELQLHATLSRSHSSLREPSLLLMSAHSAHSSAILYDDCDEDNTTATASTSATADTADTGATAAASSSGNAIVAAGARLVQDETIAAGRVQWQVYRTYFKEGSGGETLLLSIALTNLQHNYNYYVNVAACQLTKTLYCYQHYTSNHGMTGQKQLLCLARAILQRNKILVMDEASSSIDTNTDNLIQQTVRREFADCTVLSIAHRLATIADSDRILVVQDGRVSEFDTLANCVDSGSGSNTITSTASNS
eukprot:16163-Heterococcus_DN1.PRE.4